MKKKQFKFFILLSLCVAISILIIGYAGIKKSKARELPPKGETPHHIAKLYRKEKVSEYENDEHFICSVAKGETYSLEKTISSGAKVKTSVSVELPSSFEAGLEAELASETVYKEKHEFRGPAESSKHNSRSFYWKLKTIKYNIYQTIIEYNFLGEEIRRTEKKVGTATVDHIIEKYSKDKTIKLLPDLSNPSVQ